MPEAILGPFPNGIDNVSKPTALLQGSVLDAVNVDIDRAGQVSKRFGKRPVWAQNPARSIWTSKAIGMTLAVVDGLLLRVRRNGQQVATAVAGPVGNAAMSYCDWPDGSVICSNGLGIWRVRPDGDVFATLEGLGLPCPTVTVTAAGSGGLAAGNYGVAVVFVDASGEESAASAITWKDVADGGGLAVALNWPGTLGRVAGARIFRTLANGGDGGDDPVLYYVKTILPAVSSYTVVSTDLPGRSCETLNKNVMPPGSIVREYRGRLLVASGPYLWFSDPMRPAINDPRFGWVQHGYNITMLESILGGFYVGTEAGVQFYSGNRPEEWSIVKTGSSQPLPYASTAIAANNLGGNLGDTAMPLALWWSDQGLTVGMPDGQVVEPMSGRVKIPVGTGSGMALHNRRVFVGTEHTVPNDVDANPIFDEVVVLDGASQEFSFGWESVTPSVAFIIPAGSILSRASIEITEAFNGVSSALSLGIDSSPGMFLGTSENDSSVVGIFEVLQHWTAQNATPAKLFITPGDGCTSGKGIARITLEPVTPNTVDDSQGRDEIVIIKGDTTEFSFSWGDASPVTVLTVQAGTTVLRTCIEIAEPFNGDQPTLSIGIDGHPNILLDWVENDPKQVAIYGVASNWTAGSNTPVKLFITPGDGCSSGSGFVRITI